MRNIEGTWSGRITGTNNANVFVEIKQSSNAITGVVRINDPIHGVSVYKYDGSIEQDDIIFHLVPDPEYFNESRTQTVMFNGRPVTIAMSSDSGHGTVTVNAKVVNEGYIEGLWSSTIGTGGKVFLQNDGLSSSNKANENSYFKRKLVFVSYAHVDEPHLERLRIHLKPLEKKGIVDIWDDSKIKAGEHWEDEIKEALSNSAIAILIVSADFLASDFIIDNELPPILKKAELDGTRILPVILKPCRFARDEVLSKFQALNAPDKPLQAMSENEQEVLWDNLSQVIETELSR